ncbi:RidA family protein [Streptacidiphilus sp. MAP12-33]|uniref:RidA family protein n=1 Tax=Streptacidiphilus sp. MAP12-33 TaxID=3156266 RepID=UPI0035169A58
MDSKINRLTVPHLHPTPGYHHVTVVEAGRTAHLAGQCPLDAAGVLVGAGSVLEQTDQVAANALVALRAAGAEPRDVVRSVIYVRSDDRAALAQVWGRLTDSVIGAAFTTASTLLGVSQLGYPGQLVELDLTASLPERPVAETPEED